MRADNIQVGSYYLLYDTVLYRTVEQSIIVSYYTAQNRIHQQFSQGSEYTMISVKIET